MDELNERTCTCGHPATQHQYLNGCATCGKERCPSFKLRTEHDDVEFDIPDWVNGK